MTQLQPHITLSGSAGHTYTTVGDRPIGQGGQGEIWKVSREDGEIFVLKWYHQAQSTPTQQATIGHLVDRGAPEHAEHLFVWPLELVVGQDGRFGYVMRLVDTSRFKELGEWQSERGRQFDPLVLCELSYQLAFAFQQLHRAGLCYRDISQANILVDQSSGQILIVDNDNVGEPGGALHNNIMGTPDFMAPEVWTQDTLPDTRTDQYSLALLLFKFWCWHHPLNGAAEYSIRSLDIASKRKLYGESPVFIHDPDNPSNRLPDEPGYRNAQRFWDNLVPNGFKELFTKVFGQGLKEPQARPSVKEWMRAADAAVDQLIQCHACRGPNFASTTPYHCRWCGASVATGELSWGPGRRCAVAPGSRVFDERGRDGQRGVLLGEVVEHPSVQGVWGLKNMSAQEWTFIKADGTRQTVPPGRSAPIEPGARVIIDGVEIMLDRHHTPGLRR